MVLLAGNVVNCAKPLLLVILHAHITSAAETIIGRSYSANDRRNYHCPRMHDFKSHRVRKLDEMSELYSHSRKRQTSFMSIDVSDDSEVLKRTAAFMPPDWIFTRMDLRKNFIDSYLSQKDKTEFTDEDYRRSYCRMYEDGSAFYKDMIQGQFETDKTALLLNDLLWRLGNCVVGNEISKNCPNQCNKQTKLSGTDSRYSGPCEGVKGATGICMLRMPKRHEEPMLKNLHPSSSERLLREFDAWFSLIERDVQIPKLFYTHILESLLTPNHFERAARVFRRAHRLQSAIAQPIECECERSLRYDATLRACLYHKEDSMCNRGAWCGENGVCHANESTNHEVHCQCRPAFQGRYCQRPRNPCYHLNQTDTCGTHPCLRDGRNWKYGYRCGCTEGYIHRHDNRSGRPMCERVDRCATFRPCRNGGVCVNTAFSAAAAADAVTAAADGFVCRCRGGYSGPHCRTPPRPAKWAAWSEWSECRQAEGSDGQEDCRGRNTERSRTRNCMVINFEQNCQGPSKETETGCRPSLADNLKSCEDDVDDDHLPLEELDEDFEYIHPDDDGIDEEFVVGNLPTASDLPAATDIGFFVAALVLGVAILVIPIACVRMVRRCLLDEMRAKERAMSALQTKQNTEETTDSNRP